MLQNKSPRRRFRSLLTLRRASLALLLAALPACPSLAAKNTDPERAPKVEPAPTYDPTVAPAFDEAQRAIAHFKMPSDLKATVWAAEPQLINPVQINLDTHGRIWVSETNRYRGGGVLDVRNIYSWIDEELACRTVADRIAEVKRHWPDSWQELTKNPDRIRLLEDSSGGGRCDKVTVWADGFNDMADGIASGILEHKGNVYFTDIPNLWLLRDPGKTGVSTERKVLSTGYGVRYSFEGHDLHGLRMGPDGKIYFSIGDRGFNVKTPEGKQLAYPDTGGILRCDQDGSNLEVFCYGLRNPQKLCFDDHGNLFTGDNNSDHGDPAKWFYCVEGADCGWRVGYQHIQTPRATGALLMENIMNTEKNSNCLYMTPPIEHIGNGPSGCTFNPGTGMPKSFDGHFLMCDFKGGTTNSGIWTFTMQPRGASFDMAGKEHYLWQILATDVEFGNDGGFYVSDWINGWGRPNKGRIYHFFNEEASKQPIVAEVKHLMDEGFEKRSASDLAALLLHADQRVRLESQWELADRGSSSIAVFSAVAANPSAVKGSFDASRPELARLHAIWGLGELASKDASATQPLLPLLKDSDDEVRAQAAKVLGDHPNAAGYDGLVALLKDEKPRVQFFAALALGHLGNKQAVPAVLDLLARNADKDAYVRHAAVMALTWIHDPESVLPAAHNESAAVRLGVLLALRRWQRPEVAGFLHDADPRIVLEASRAVDDEPIESGRPALATLLKDHKLEEPVLRRALNANFREGKSENATAIAKFAASDDAPASVRIEALESLEEWAKPSIRDHIMGLIWPLPDKERDEKVVDAAAQPVLGAIIKVGPELVRLAGLKLAEKTGLTPLDAATDLVNDAKASPESRAAALRVLAAQNSPTLAASLQTGLLSKAPVLRREAIRLQTSLPDAAAKLDAILAQATPADQQAVFSALPQVPGEAADQILSLWMDKLLARQVSVPAQLDLLDAAAKSKSAAVQAKVKQFDAARDPKDTLSNWRECMEGGDAIAGKKIFFQKVEVSCTRCHLIGKEGGGNVGPNLGDIGKRQSREYILESIVDPNAKIAPGFESANIKLNNGKFYTGVVKGETDADVTLDTGTDHGILKIKKSDIKKRTPAPSPMPQDIAQPLSKQELRSLVEFLADQKG